MLIQYAVLSTPSRFTHRSRDVCVCVCWWHNAVFLLASALFWLRFRHYIVHYAHAHQCHCPPKLLAGRWHLPFGAQPIFWGYVTFKEGTWGIIPVSKSLVTSIYKAIWSAVKQQPDPLSRTWSTLYWPSLWGDYAGLTPLHHASSEVSEGKSRFCWFKK